MEKIRCARPLGKMFTPIPGHEGYYHYKKDIFDQMETMKWGQFFEIAREACTGEWTAPGVEQFPAKMLPDTTYAPDLELKVPCKDGLSLSDTPLVPPPALVDASGSSSTESPPEMTLGQLQKAMQAQPYSQGRKEHLQTPGPVIQELDDEPPAPPAYFGIKDLCAKNGGVYMTLDMAVQVLAHGTIADVPVDVHVKAIAEAMADGCPSIRTKATAATSSSR